MNSLDQKKARKLKALVYLLELSALVLALYIILLPFYPEIRYYLENRGADNKAAKSEEAVAIETEKIVKTFDNNLPQSEYAISSNRLIITKIGLNAPIVESANADYGLDRGAWLMPDGSKPDKGGNTIITGHRFKYFPPNNLTFYLFDKLEAGDIISVIWNKDYYYYKISEVKIVPDTDFSILKPSKKPIITLFTCHPIYSTENRLVIIGELIEK